MFSGKDYSDTLRKGMAFVRGMSGRISADTGSRAERINRLADALRNAEAVVIGAGAGLSTAAGFTYSGERFNRWFFDFRERFGFSDMYSGGFYSFPDEETKWAFWARNIYVNRYTDAPKPIYSGLMELIRNKDYFVITTNVDHCFQKAGCEKNRLFYTQGDYGLFQPLRGKPRITWDNEEWVRKAMAAQRFIPDGSGGFTVPKDRLLSMRLPKELVPTCPQTGGPVALNLRVDDTFVEDEGWRDSAGRYVDFLEKCAGKRTLFLELGVGGNTPMIIKYPFWAMTDENPNAVYACLNFDDAFCPEEIEDRSICLDGDCGEIIGNLGTMI